MNAREFTTNLAYRLVSQNILRQYEQGLDAAKRKSETLHKAQTQQLGHYSSLFLKTYQSLARAHASTHAQMQRTGISWIAQAKKDVMGLDALYRRVFTGIRTMVPMALGAAASGVAALGTAIGTVGKRYELLQAQLATTNSTNLFGGKEFWRVMQFRRDNAAMTSAEQMLAAYGALKNAGLDTSNASLRAYGNLAAGTNQTFDQAANNAAQGEQGFDAFGIGHERIDKNGDAWANGEYLKLTFRGVTTVIRNTKEEIDAYYKSLGNGPFKYGLSNQMATTDAKFMRFGATLEYVSKRLWEGGLKQQAHRFLEWATKTVIQLAPLVEKWMPKLVSGAVDFAEKALPKIWKGIQMIGKLGPYVLGFLGVMTLRMIGLKILMAADWIVTFAARAIFWLNTLTLRAIIFNAVAFAIPVAIGVALAALAYIGYQVYKYVTEGEKGIEGLRKKFPMLADGVVYLGERWKEIQPHLMKLISRTWELIVVIGEKLLPVAQWVFMKVIVPAIMGIIVLWTELVTWVLRAINYLGEGGIGKTVKDLWEGFKSLFAYLRTEFPWLESMAGAIGRAMGWVGGLFGGANGDSGNSAIGPGGPGGAGLANTAMRFITSGAGDALAKRDPLGLFRQGVACNYLVNQMIAAAGASKALQSQLTNRVPDTIRNLMRAGMIEVVPFSQVQPGDIATAGNFSHIGMIGQGGKLIHASNSHGGEIGRGQRPVIAGNYFGASGHYYRIKSQYLNQAQVPVGLPAGPQSSKVVNNYITVNNKQSFSNPPGQPLAVGRLTGTGIGDSLAQTLPRD